MLKNVEWERKLKGRTKNDIMTSLREMALKT